MPATLGPPWDNLVAGCAAPSSVGPCSPDLLLGALRPPPSGPAPQTCCWVPVGAPMGDTAPMGYNPYRKHRAGPADFALVGAALLVALGLLVWGFLG